MKISIINKTKLQKLKISGTFKSYDLKFLGKVLTKTEDSKTSEASELKNRSQAIFSSQKTEPATHSSTTYLTCLITH